MLTTQPGLMDDIRDRFDQIDHCPVQGPRIFFENAGGALTLKSVVESTAEFAAIPDNQGRANVASKHLEEVIDTARQDMRSFFNVGNGQVFVGESGTELLFRLIRTACLGVKKGGNVVGSTLEHPASRSAAIRWSEIAGKRFVSVPHNDETGSVTADDYRAHVTPATRVATILHASPVTGISVDVAEIARSIRKISPDCVIIVDGIQYAAHGGIDIEAYGIDGYVISPYKVFSRHGYGIAWASDRLTAMPRDTLLGGPAKNWELGTRDTGAYATFSKVVDYFDWLGSRVSNASDRRARLVAAGQAIGTHEKRLADLVLSGAGGYPGLRERTDCQVIGGADNAHRAGLVSFALDGHDPASVVAILSAHGIRTHIRKPDHYSGNILNPLGLDGCVRVSFCHYNTEAEVVAFLIVMADIAP